MGCPCCPPYSAQNEIKMLLKFDVIRYKAAVVVNGTPEHASGSSAPENSRLDPNMTAGVLWICSADKQSSFIGDIKSKL